MEQEKMEFRRISAAIVENHSQLVQIPSLQEQERKYPFGRSISSV